MTPSGDDEERTTTEAARWLVALSDSPDDAALRARFDAWLKASPAHASAWADTVAIDAMMAKLPPAHAARWAPYAAARRPAGASTRRRMTLGVAAAALAACLALVVAPPALLRLQADHASATAEIRSVRLEDGSRVRLGPDSAIALAFGEGRRIVRLLQGEAFFEVTQDSDRPFVVAARGVEMTVLGTAFDVRLGDAVTAVAVRNGQVQVDYPAAKPPVSQRLEAGDWMRVAEGGAFDHGRAPPGEVAAWLRGQIVARDRALADVVDELGRYYVGTIILTDRALGLRRVSGVYNVADPVAALDAVAGAHGGSVRRISPWILLVSGG